MMLLEPIETESKKPKADSSQSKTPINISFALPFSKQTEDGFFNYVCLCHKCLKLEFPKILVNRVLASYLNWSV